MKRLIITLMIASTLLIVGCSKKQQEPETNSDLTTTAVETTTAETTTEVTTTQATTVTVSSTKAKAVAKKTQKKSTVSFAEAPPIKIIPVPTESELPQTIPPADLR